MGNFKFGDISTKDLDLVIQFKPTYDFPERDMETFHIPGRNGDLVITNDSFKNTTRSYSVASVFKPGTDFVANSQRLIEWLTAHPGYHRLEDSYDPDVYRLAMFKSRGSLPNYYDKATVLDVQFDCKPQRYLKIGEKVTEYSFAQVANLENISINIENPTQYKALPEITFKNIPDSGEKVLMFNVINYKEEVTSSIILDSVPDDTLTIDSEKQLVYKIQNGMIKNLNRYVHLNGKPFPSLEEKTNKLEIKKYNKMSNIIDKYSTLIDNIKKVLFAKYLPFDTVLQSKQSNAKIKSFMALKNSKKETYDAEAYGNLALDSAEYYEFKSFNKVLEENGFMVGFNTDTTKGPDYTNINKCTISINLLLGVVKYKINDKDVEDLTADDIKTINNTIAIFSYQTSYRDSETDEIVKRLGYRIIVLRPLVDKDNVEVDDEEDSILYNGAFVKLNDVMDGSYDSLKIIYVPTTSIDTLLTEQNRTSLKNIIKGTYVNDIVYLFDKKGISKKKIENLSGENSHDVIISIYPANTGKVLYVDYSYPEWMDLQYVYDSDSSNPSIIGVNYKPKKTGYYYKEKTDSGNGLLSGLVGALGGLISKLFNKSGWNYINVDSQNDTNALESVTWDSNKKAFVLGSLLSTNEDYTVARYFIEAGHLPQYQDEVLDNVYETDDKGNVKTDTAGNKINKVIKSRIEITSTNNDLSKITGVKIKEKGFYSFNEDSDGNPNQWYYYTADTPLPQGTLEARGFNTSSKSANKIHYLETIPDYRDEKEFPEWLDPIPMLLNASGEEISPSLSENRMNAPRYTFKTKKPGWYWYEYVEDNVTKKTIWTPLAEDSEIENYDPDPSTVPGKLSNEDFSIYFTNYKVDWVTPIGLTSEDFPIHDYEYVETTNSEYYGKHFILNQSCDSYSSSETYEIGDYVENDDMLYICIEAITSPEPFDPSKWKYLGNLIDTTDIPEAGSEYLENHYYIIDRKLYECTEETIQGPKDNPLAWNIIGEYIKNIGLLYLTETGEEEEIPYNILPDWVRMHIVRGTEEDYSDTSLEFYSVQNGLFKWDSNQDWITKNSGDLVATATYKQDTTISYMDSLPEYNESLYNNLYDLSEIQQAENGNPEKVIVKAKQAGYYKIASSNNYEYYKADAVLNELSVNQDLSIVYLSPESSQGDLRNIVLQIKPRWWSL